MGATEHAGFRAKVQRNLGLDFVTKQHKSLQKTSASLQLSVSDMSTLVLTFLVSLWLTLATADTQCCRSEVDNVCDGRRALTAVAIFFYVPRQTGKLLCGFSFLKLAH